MVKVVMLVNKHQDLTRDDFKNYWLTKHKELELDALKKDLVQKVIVSFATGEVIGCRDAPYDAMVEMYFSSIEDMKAQFNGDRDRIMLEDEKNFINPLEPRIFVVTEEYLIGEKISDTK